MAGLVAYGSSDEEDEPQYSSKAESPSERGTEKVAEIENSSKTPIVPVANSNRQTASATNEAPTLKTGNEAPLVGPTIGPIMPTDVEMVLSLPEQDEQLSTPQSPYTANRTAIRELTLPSIPNLDIPPSPPQSPPPSTNAKFAHFLKLKKQGVHFNEKLAKSSALKNPSLMQKLMDFAEIGEDNEYATSLAHDLWNPKGFPSWTYKEELATSQQNVLKQQEAEKKGRTAVDFVSATTSNEPSRNGILGPVSGSKVAPLSAAERVMAGLERGRSTPPVHAGMKRKTRFES